MVDKQKLGTFILGGVAGAMAGIFLAPRSGKELRGSLANRAGEAREKGRETYFDARERARERRAEALDYTPPAEGDLDLTVGPPPDEEPILYAEPSVSSPEPPPILPPEAPTLRDVSREEPAVAAGAPSEGAPAGDPEELRRRIQETRSRLRARLNRPGGGGPERTGG